MQIRMRCGLEEEQLLHGIKTKRESPSGWSHAVEMSRKGTLRTDTSNGRRAASAKKSEMDLSSSGKATLPNPLPSSSTAELRSIWASNGMDRPADCPIWM